MTAFFLSVWLAVSAFFGFVPEKNNGPMVNTEVQPPKDTPRNSAPPVAIEACNNKEIDQNCSFSLSDQDLKGICQPSGDVLACTPRLPE